MELKRGQRVWLHVNGGVQPYTYLETSDNLNDPQPYKVVPEGFGGEEEYVMWTSRVYPTPTEAIEREHRLEDGLHTYKFGEMFKRELASLMRRYDAQFETDDVVVSIDRGSVWGDEMVTVGETFSQ